MFDFGMFATPQAREAMFNMMAQQMSQAPPHIKEALSRVPVTIIKRPRGFELQIGESDDREVEAMIQGALSNRSELLTRGFDAMGYEVHLYE